jgi:Uma2 family endonuclease
MNLVDISQFEYPETDGIPMGETEVHVHWANRLRDILKHRYRGQQVYVGANMFIYYVEGQPFWNICPDVFVVLDCDPHVRNVFKTWEEKRVPAAVFEITSLHTGREDLLYKPHKYESFQVAEYVMYDPRAEYLRPPLTVLRMTSRGYEPVEPNERGQVECQSLGITLELDGRDLLLRDATTKAVLLTQAESAETGRDTAQAERDAAQAERDAAKAERDAAQAERDTAQAERDAAKAERDAAQARAEALESELRRLQEGRD